MDITSNNELTKDSLTEILESWTKKLSISFEDLSPYVLIHPIQSGELMTEKGAIASHQFNSVVLLKKSDAIGRIYHIPTEFLE